MSEENTALRELAESEYKYGFVSKIEEDSLPPGLNEDTVRFIAKKKNEPEWLLEWRRAAFARWQTMEEPDWAHIGDPGIACQDIG